MAKNDNDNLVWRLKEQPTTESLRQLVKDQILTKDEARQILFSKDNSNDKMNALKEQVKFLEDLVKNLSTNHGTTWINNYPAYTPVYPVRYWYSTGIGMGTYYTANTGANTISLSSSLGGGQAQSSLGNLTGGTTLTGSSSSIN
jgi:hypothetical protein